MKAVDEEDEFSKNSTNNSFERTKMSESNVTKLKNAYRHPFEYISPLLYRQNKEAEDDELDFDASELYCAEETEFNELSMQII
jgi:hypothetical protein